MSVARMLTQTATITNNAAASTDSEGNWVPGSATITTESCRLERIDFQARAKLQEFYAEGTDQLVAIWLLFLLPTSVITGRSLVTVMGRNFEVDGEPIIEQTPRGPHHIEARLRTVSD